jgi:hypothetical protein
MLVFLLTKHKLQKAKPPLLIGPIDVVAISATRSDFVVGGFVLGGFVGDISYGGGERKIPIQSVASPSAEVSVNVRVVIRRSRLLDELNFICRVVLGFHRPCHGGRGSAEIYPDQDLGLVFLLGRCHARRWCCGQNQVRG